MDSLERATTALIWVSVASIALMGVCVAVIAGAVVVMAGSGS